MLLSLLILLRIGAVFFRYLLLMGFVWTKKLVHVARLSFLNVRLMYVYMMTLIFRMFFRVYRCLRIVRYPPNMMMIIISRISSQLRMSLTFQFIIIVVVICYRTKNSIIIICLFLQFRSTIVIIFFFNLIWFQLTSTKGYQFTKFN